MRREAQTAKTGLRALVVDWADPDQSKQPRADDGSQLAEAMFSRIYAISADAIISIDETHHITIFNEGAQNIFGYSPDEVLGTPLDLLIPERFRSVHRQHIEQFAAGQTTARRMTSRGSQIYGLRKNGEEFPTDAAISKLDLGGKILLTVSLRDISEQRRSENEQRLLAEVGEILVNAGSDFHRLLTDIASVIVRNVAAWCAVDIVQVGGIPHPRIVHADPARTALCDALTHEPIDRLRELDPGSLIVPLVARGQTLGTLAVGPARHPRSYDARDVKLAEQLATLVAMALANAQLHQALERAILARDEVLGIVAHDLRNPLNTIMLRAQMLQRRGLQPDRRDPTATASILRSVKSMHRLIEDLLDVTRLEAGQSLSIQPTSLQVADILAEVLERQQAAALAAHHVMPLESEHPPPTVWADRTRLLQVFDNLLGNAMKFARERITVGAGTKGNDALFWVTDDGPGISAENLPRIFDRFWQASKRDGQGAGLGLSIAQGIVHAINFTFPTLG
jgi:PAS domain S-box-containing protein